MINIWFQYKYNTINNILNSLQENSIIDYAMIWIFVIATVIIIFFAIPKLKVILKTKGQEKEKKRRKDKLKYLTYQNEIQTEIEKRFAEEDKKEIEEKLKQIKD